MIENAGEDAIVISDSELVARARSGDVEAFGELVGRYERMLLGIAIAKMRNLHEAEDVVQETLLLAFRRLATLNDGSKFAGWLAAIAHRQVIDAARRRKSVVRTVRDQLPHDLAAAELKSWVEQNAVLDFIARLPVHEQALIGQRFFDGHSVAEIAQLTGRPVGTVTKQLSRALARLRQWSEKEMSQ